mmetsp:Transcript_23573/g.54869  ORF Transcript_23573/g.54869 Transcript_23573/m.54869 type:complete len:118 (-) Transcript_23573:84-437(-)
MAVPDFKSKDYYKILGLERDASPSEISAAYQRLATQDFAEMPPSKGVGEEKFRKITQAYEVLIDEHRRKVYDKVGTESLSRAVVEFNPKPQLKRPAQRKVLDQPGETTKLDMTACPW